MGNYGGAWQDQRKEFDAFPGAILMTTNCIQKPQGQLQGPHLHHRARGLAGRDAHRATATSRPVIEAALAAAGLRRGRRRTRPSLSASATTPCWAWPTRSSRRSRRGAIRHFFLIGGCDGAKPGRNYYTEFAEAVPDDCVILTLACGKYRFNKLDFGDIGGIPRLLDIGQCNDAYSAIQIAVALAEAFEYGRQRACRCR